MSRTIAAALCLLMLAVPSLPRPSRDSKFDEFDFRDCESLVARLDNFAATMQDIKGWRGLVIIYGGKVVERGETGLYAERIRRYVTGYRGVEGRKLLFVFGGYRRKAGAELILVPDGVAVPAATPSLQQKDVVFKNEKFKGSKYDCAKGPWPK